RRADHEPDRMSRVVQLAGRRQRLGELRRRLHVQPGGKLPDQLGSVVGRSVDSPRQLVDEALRTGRAGDPPAEIAARNPLPDDLVETSQYTHSGLAPGTCTQDSGPVRGPLSAPALLEATEHLRRRVDDRIEEDDLGSDLAAGFQLL